jgi:hypothetical protein
MAKSFCCVVVSKTRARMRRENALPGHCERRRSNQPLERRFLDRLRPVGIECLEGAEAARHRLDIREK